MLLMCGSLLKFKIFTFLLPCINLFECVVLGRQISENCGSSQTYYVTWTKWTPESTAGNVELYTTVQMASTNV